MGQWNGAKTHWINYRWVQTGRYHHNNGNLEDQTGGKLNRQENQQKYLKVQNKT